MAMQQLDLFAAFNAPPVQEAKPKPAPAPVAATAETVASEPEQPAITPPPMAEADTAIVTAPAAAAAPIPEPVEKAVVFADEKIAVKIKPKVAVQMPAAQSRPVIITNTSAAAAPKEKSVVAEVVKPKSKRGRKSYKEIDAELDLIEVPDDETLAQKLYYSITEVAKWFKVNASLLRYWENEFDILKPRKNRKGDRLFRPEDIKNLQVIYYLLRNRKFSIEGAKKYLRNHRQQADTNVQLAQSLTKFRSFLLELKANLGA